ncbi:hydroxylysine kinase-like isoform X3 [Conger conger]|nr:hydroxylysine kinase-like isoform X3 [Conger conger]XP_061084482.1 hydroxylysine kinase-like isoform X3 [Conger conger]XP_061084483.1 hydroxylysine kinase-like isoform X3 [Conger conger]
MQHPGTSSQSEASALVKGKAVMSMDEAQPRLSEPQASQLLGRLFGLTVSLLRPLPSYHDQNFHVVAGEGGQYLLKITNCVFSQNVDRYELQNHALAFLHQHGLPVQTVLPTLTGTMMSLEDIDCGSGSQKYLVRLLTFLPGTTIANIHCSPRMLYEVGRMAATTNTMLQKMEHPKLWALKRENNPWDLGNVHLLEPYLPALEGEDELRLVKDVMMMFKTEVLVHVSSFRKSPIHGDFNDQNIIVEPDSPIGYRISGILDFGSMNYGYSIFELAITIMYMMIESQSPLEVGGAVLAGWESILPLDEVERDALYTLVLVRFCQSLVMAHHTAALRPENKDYLMITARKGIRLLPLLWKLGKEAVLKKWVDDAREYSDRK